MDSDEGAIAGLTDHSRHPAESNCLREIERFMPELTAISGQLLETLFAFIVSFGLGCMLRANSIFKDG